MNYLEIRERIDRSGSGKMVLDYDVSSINSLGTGGKAAALIRADSIEGLVSILELLDSNSMDYVILGSGTNTVFPDGAFGTIIVKLGKSFDYCSFKDDGIICTGGACSTQALVMKAARQGYDLSPLAGIPGTIGGAVSGNSGTGSWGICDYIITLKAIFKYNDKIVYDEIDSVNIEYGYRYFKLKGLIAITELMLKTRKDKAKNILPVIHGDVVKRKISQPVGAKTCGCFFKNPSGIKKSAGAMIDECGMKDFYYGGAKVSNKHANFIENSSNATSEDIVVLSRIMKDRVKEKFDTELDYEVKMIGF
ncbi:MAG: UDP-N-acetylmuramate dehydrogenase [Actinobacteria bacterium]|nr:UDP-N-acetylmuramate dehydrogenase [Actinomycetota bacterium]